jgi:uncharacterized protein (DUF1501 family)
MLNEDEETLCQSWKPSRRNLLAMGTAAGIAGLLGTHPASAQIHNASTKDVQIGLNSTLQNT